MALALITSYQLKSSTTGTTALVTPSFTPSNGEVITIGWETFDPTITMTITNSGSQTFGQKQLEQPGGFNGTCAMHAGTIAGSPGSMTITGTPSASARYSMTVERWSGAVLAGSPVVNGNTGTTGTMQSTLTPTGGAGGVIVWVGQDSQSVDPSTRTYAGSGTDDGIRDDHVGANGVGYHGYQTITGNTSQTYGLTAPTGLKWVIAGIEIQPAATATYVPPAPTRRRLAAPTRRRVAGSAIKTQFLPIPPYVPPFIPRTRLKLPRRRTVAGSAIKTQFLPIPPIPPVPPVHARLRALLPRRARITAVAPAQQTIQAPAYVAPFLRARSKFLRSVRGHATLPPIGQQTPPVPPGRARLKLPRWFRSSATPAPAPQITPPVPPGRARLKLPRWFRSSATQTPILQQSAPTPPTYVAPFARSIRRIIRIGRSRISLAPIAQQSAPTPPAYVAPAVRSRSRLLRWFRPAITSTPIGQALPPVPAGRPRPRLLRIFRGRAATVTPPQVTVQAPTYVPPVTRARGRALNVRRPRGAAVPVPAVPPPTAPPYVAPFARALRRGLKLFRPRIAEVAANGQAAPVVPPPVVPPAAPNGWFGLLGLVKEARSIRRESLYREDNPIACPHDGEILAKSRDGIWYCRYDGFVPEGQTMPIKRNVGGGEWGNIRSVIDATKADGKQDRKRRFIACPNDGEPLRRSVDGFLYCPFDGWMPPQRWYGE